MPERHLFEYAVIRAVPRVEREEFVNVGVILYCSGQRFLNSLHKIDEERLIAFSPQFDVQQFEEYLRAFEQICKGLPKGGPIGKLPIAERFRWLTATRSSILQTSPVHPGLCTSSKEALWGIFENIVL